jgi:GNAT superfamily N-acetyltransferase
MKYSTIHRNEVAFAERAFDAGMVFIETSDGFSVNGWMCAKWSSPKCLHWMYVPPELRGMGVGSHMISEILGKGVEVSRWPESMRKSSLPVGRWNPYRMLEVEESQRSKELNSPQ